MILHVLIITLILRAQEVYCMNPETVCNETLSSCVMTIFDDGNDYFYPADDIHFFKFKNLIIIGFQAETIPLDTSRLFSAVKRIKAKNMKFIKLVPEEFKVGDFQHLKELDLSNNSIESLNSQDFQGAKVLEKLYLNNNQIDTIYSYSFDRLINLIYLDISYNRLKDLATNTFYNLINLQTLKLDHNFLENIDFLIFNTILGEVILKNNCIKSLPTSLDGTKLYSRRLDLSNNLMIDVSDLKKIPNLNELILDNNPSISWKNDTFNKMSNLKNLSLDNTNLSSVPAPWNSLTSLTALTKLSIRNNNLSQIPFDKFPLSGNLKTLLVSENNLTELDVPESAKLTLLSIENNAWNCSYLTKLKESLEHRKINLTNTNVKCISGAMDESIRNLFLVLGAILLIVLFVLFIIELIKECIQRSRVGRYQYGVPLFLENSGETHTNGLEMTNTTSRPQSIIQVDDHTYAVPP